MGEIKLSPYQSLSMKLRTNGQFSKTVVNAVDRSVTLTNCYQNANTFEEICYYEYPLSSTSSGYIQSVV